jgi:PDZ domain-containing protein
MMFAIGIIDKLTPGALTQGKIIAGTGTIDPDGNVGEIGGIQQKLIGARDAGALLFLAPEDNCDEVIGHIPDGLTVAAIETLEDAMDEIEAFNAGKSVTPCVK